MTDKRQSMDMDTEAFRRIGHALIDQIADHFDRLPQKKVTPGETPSVVRAALGKRDLPEIGTDAESVIRQALNLTIDHSLFVGHPRFWGYIVGAGTPIGVLSDLLASAVNPNVGGWNLAPMATEMELQAIEWIAQFIGYPRDAGGILVSGGAMANYVGFLTARRNKGPENIRTAGLTGEGQRLRVYCSAETHTWIQKAADLFGLGTDAIAWIGTTPGLRMDLEALETAILRDLEQRMSPFMVVGTAGSVSTGVVDDLAGISVICKKYNLWFHVDGAYGGPAAGIPELSDVFNGLHAADSIALDPHKWFYAPLEAGCTLVRDARHLVDTFSYRPPYYHFEEGDEVPGTNLYEYGFQNSREFRALKVWTGFMQAGRTGMQGAIRHDIEMAGLLYRLVDNAEDFQAFQVNLSITTFRYIHKPSAFPIEKLNQLNEEIMIRLQRSGSAFITHAVIHGQFFLRTCIVNFRTQPSDVEALPDLIRQIALEILSAEGSLN